MVKRLGLSDQSFHARFLGSPSACTSALSEEDAEVAEGEEEEDDEDEEVGDGEEEDNEGGGEGDDDEDG